MSMENPAWGQHLILDFAGCDKSAIGDANTLRTWINDLVNVIGMKAHGDPQLSHFATHNHASAGYTLVQLIETSNICAHFAENIGQAYIDIFSCREFDVTAAEKICCNYFTPREVVRTNMQRGQFGNRLAEVG